MESEPEFSVEDQERSEQKCEEMEDMPMGHPMYWLRAKCNRYLGIEETKTVYAYEVRDCPAEAPTTPVYVAGADAFRADKVKRVYVRMRF